MADINYFIAELKRIGSISENSKIIVFGCGYAGTLATWSRMVYPNVIHGAIARSAPLLVKEVLYEFGSHVIKVVNEIDSYCIDALREALYWKLDWCHGGHKENKCEGKNSYDNYVYKLNFALFELVQYYNKNKIARICRRVVSKSISK